MKSKESNTGDINLEELKTAINRDIQWLGDRYNFSNLGNEKLRENCYGILSNLESIFEGYDEASFLKWRDVNHSQLDTFLELGNTIHLSKPEFHRLWSSHEKEGLAKKYINIIETYEHNTKILCRIFPYNDSKNKKNYGSKEIENMPKIGAKFDEKEVQKELIYKDNSIFRQYTLRENFKRIENEKCSPKEKFKIHLGIDINQYIKFLPIILNVLEKSLDDGIIEQFKVINTEVITTKEMQDRILRLKSINEESLLANNCRVFNNPITISLSDDFDSNKISKLCLKLEMILSSCPFEKDCLSKADILLTNHISLRQETLDGKYVKIDLSNMENINKLREEAIESIAYKSINHEINTYRETLLFNLLQLRKDTEEKILDTAGTWCFFKKIIPDGIERLRDILKGNLDSLNLHSLLIITASCSQILDDKKSPHDSKEPHKVLYNKWRPIFNDLLNIKLMHEKAKPTVFDVV